MRPQLGDPVDIIIDWDADAPTIPFGDSDEWSFSKDGRNFAFTIAPNRYIFFFCFVVVDFVDFVDFVYLFICLFVYLFIYFLLVELHGFTIKIFVSSM